MKLACPYLIWFAGFSDLAPCAPKLHNAKTGHMPNLSAERPHGEARGAGATLEKHVRPGTGGGLDRELEELLRDQKASRLTLFLGGSPGLPLSVETRSRPNSEVTLGAAEKTLLLAPIWHSTVTGKASASSCPRRRNPEQAASGGSDPILAFPASNIYIEAAFSQNPIIACIGL